MKHLHHQTCLASFKTCTRVCALRLQLDWIGASDGGGIRGATRAAAQLRAPNAGADQTCVLATAPRPDLPKSLGDREKVETTL